MLITKGLHWIDLEKPSSGTVLQVVVREHVCSWGPLEFWAGEADLTSH